MTAAARRREGAFQPKTVDNGREPGTSLAEWVEALGEPEGKSDEASVRLTAPPHPADEIGHMARTLDALAERLDAAEARQALTASGIDKLVREALARLEEGEREQTAVAARFEGAFQEVSQEQARLSARLATMEAEARGPRSLEALRALEAALTKVAAQLHSREETSAQLLANVRLRIEALESERTHFAAGAEDALRGFEGRLEALAENIAGQGEAARAAEQRAAAAIERMGHQMVDVSQALMRKVQSAEARGAEAIEQVGGEVARIATSMEARLGHADTVQAQALERLGAEIERISERLAERIAQSDQRSAAAIDDVGDQVARITERLGQRQERATDDLADRIRQSEERTARLLEEARATISQLAAGVSMAPPPETVADAPEEAQGETPPSAEAVATSVEIVADAIETAPAAEALETPAETASAGDLVGDDPFETFGEKMEPDTSMLDRLAKWDEENDFPVFRPLDEFHPKAPEALEVEAADEAAAGPALRSAWDDEPSILADDAPAGEMEDDAADEALASPWSPPPPAPEARPFAFSGPRLLDQRRTSSRRHGRQGGRTAALGLGLAAAFGLALGGFIIAENEPPAKLADLFRTRMISPKAGEPNALAAMGPQAALALGPLAAPTGASAAQAQALYATAAARIAAGDNSGLGDLRRAADLGYAPAQFYLAKLYETGGAGLGKDPVSARRWTERAAEGGDPRAMHNLGLFTFDGEGGPKDPVAAAGWFRRAADLGLPDSQYNLARLYERGVGVPQNLAESYKWYLVAARSGDPLSKAGAARVKLELTPDAKAVAERSAQAFRASAPTEAPAPAAASEVVTAQKALTSLGYYRGPADGAATPALKMALAAYQHDQGLPETGQTDAVTIGRLTAVAR